MLPLKQATPHWTKFLNNIPDTIESSALLKLIKTQCFHGKLLSVDSSGYGTAEKISFSSKMETLLQICLERRRTIAGAEGLTQTQLSQHHATKTQMKKMYNSWRKDIKTWMNKENQQKYSDFQNARINEKQKAHQLAHSCFHTYLFHISGCKFLLGKLIQLPIISTAGPHTPRVMRALIDSLKAHKKSAEYRKEVKKYNERSKERQRLSQQLWWSKFLLQKGRVSANNVLESRIPWSTLSRHDQNLVTDYNMHKLKDDVSAIEARKAGRSPAYRGTHVEALAYNERY